MKRLFTPTLAWIIAAVIAVLLAYAGPETGMPPWHHVDLPVGSLAR